MPKKEKLNLEAPGLTFEHFNITQLKRIAKFYKDKFNFKTTGLKGDELKERLVNELDKRLNIGNGRLYLKHLGDYELSKFVKPVAKKKEKEKPIQESQPIQIEPISIDVTPSRKNEGGSAQARQNRKRKMLV